MTEHTIKCWKQYFEDVQDGIKTFDVRKKDRDYKLGDTLVLEEFRGHMGEYTGRRLTKRVVYYAEHDDSPLGSGIAEGYCIMGLE